MGLKSSGVKLRPNSIAGTSAHGLYASVTHLASALNRGKISRTMEVAYGTVYIF